MYKFLKIPIEKEFLTFNQEYLRSGYLPSDNWSAHVCFNNAAKEKLQAFHFNEILVPTIPPC